MSNKNTTESIVKCIKCIVCDLTLKTDSGLKVHTDLMHRNVSGNQGKVECSHCLEKFSDLTLMKKHNKREHIYISVFNNLTIDNSQLYLMSTIKYRYRC